MNTAPDQIIREANYGAAATQQKTRWYQTILRVAAGFPNVVANGNHNDSETRKSLKQFQRFYKLQETGYLQVDSNLALTQRALEWIYRTSLPTRKGSPGQSLSDQIRQFQKDYGLTSDGKVGAITRDVMIKVLTTAIPSPLRRYHRTLGPESAAAAPAAGNACQLVSSMGCWLSTETMLPSGIIGADDRIAVADSRILAVPWRWMCLLSVRFDDPDGGPPIFQRGTGILISAQHVLTAAHVVFDEIDGSQGTRAKSEPAEIIVVPACHGLIPSSTRSRYKTLPHQGRSLVTPFGAYKAVGNPLYQAPVGWISTLDHRYDYAVCRLDKPVGFLKIPGQPEQRLGWWGSAAHGSGSVIQPESKEVLLNRTINVSGFPHCNPQFAETYRQWASNNPIREIALNDAVGPAPEWIGHSADARQGTSGGPIWVLSADGTRNLIGICIMAGRLTSTGDCVNFGLHLNPDVWSEIKGWMG